MDEGESLESSLEDLVRSAEILLDERPAGAWALGPERGLPEAEVIETAWGFTIILDCPGLSEISSCVVGGAEVCVRAGELEFSRRLPCTVDGSTIKHEYRNGTLSVVVRKQAGA